MSDIGATAPTAIGGGIGLWAALRFVRWLVEFVFKRLDVSRGHLGDRLRHVEQELDAYRTATMLMIGVVAKLDPDNPALQRVARILSATVPRATMELDELEARLNAAEGRTSQGGQDGMVKS